MSKKRWPFYLSLIAVGLLTIGCATLSPRPEPGPLPPEPEPHPVPPPPPPATTRIFPEFVVLIVQPGDTLSSLALKYLNDPSMDWVIAEFNGIRSLGPGEEVIIPLFPYGKGGLSQKGHQTVPILSYHKFSKDKADILTVTERAFEEQMRFLKENGYRVIRMDDFFEFLEYKRPLPRKAVVITMDDNWYSAYEIAFPILKKYGYPATLFVYTDLILPGRKTLNWDLLALMSRSGIDVQSHTKSHRNLDKREGQESFREYFETVKKELTESAEMIRRRLNTEVKYLAYPYGETNPLIVALLEKLGYRGAFTVERGGNPFFVHPYRINRSMIYGTFDLKEFERNLNYFHDQPSR